VLDQPVVKLICRISARGFADIPGFFICFGAGLLLLKLQLHRALDILAELSSLVIDVSVYWHGNNSSCAVCRNKGFVK
jgi:hypothetical protein